MYIIKDFKKKYELSFIDPKNINVCDKYTLEAQKQDILIAQLFAENEANMVMLAINIINSIECNLPLEFSVISPIKIEKMKSELIKALDNTFITIAKEQYKEQVELIIGEDLNGTGKADGTGAEQPITE